MNVGVTLSMYVVTSAGKAVALSVRSKGAWKPRCERMGEPQAPCQSLLLRTVKPCPEPTAFQPTMPMGSHIWAKATATASGVNAGGASKATASLFVSRVTAPYGRIWLTRSSEICSGPPNVDHGLPIAPLQGLNDRRRELIRCGIDQNTPPGMCETQWVIGSMNS